jgi:hypothetical protein
MPGRGNLPRGMDLIDRQGLNKGTAFTDAERAALGLHGLLPPNVETLEEQSHGSELGSGAGLPAARRRGGSRYHN